MKNLRSIVLYSILLAVIFSCGEEITVEEPTNFIYEGNWSLAELDHVATSETLGSLFFTSSKIEGQGKDLNFELKLLDGKFTAKGDYRIDLTMTNSPFDDMVFQRFITDYDQSGSFTVDENKIFFDDNPIDIDVSLIPVSLPYDITQIEFLVEDDQLTLIQSGEISISDVNATHHVKLNTTTTWIKK